MKNVVNEIGLLSKSHIHIKDQDKLNEILNNMVQGGVGKLQVITDFDKTITKQHMDGAPHLSSFGMFSRIPTCMANEKFREAESSLKKKYYPIEIDPNVPMPEKIKLMEEWWDLSEKSLSGLKVTQQDIEDVCRLTKPSLRDGTLEFFKDLKEQDVPVLVFSAGCGDIVKTVLDQSGVYLSNLKVISNFLQFAEDGTILGFQNKLIHVFNKNEYAVKASDFYNVVKDRDNAFVIGDSLGDANMAEGMEHCQNLLKIGFLYEHAEEALPQYLDVFDIVLVDDQTMEVPKAVFDYIKNCSL